MKSSDALQEKTPSFICSIRFLLSILCFFLNAIHYMQRVNLSVAIVSMVDTKTCINGSQNANLTADGLTNISASYENDCQNKYNWSKTIQGILHSSIFVGIILSQVVGGWASLKFGPKIVLGITILAASILTVLTPVAAQISFILLIFLRFLIGLAQGCLTTSINLLWTYWAPPLERSTLVSISNSGSLIGNAFAFLAGGILAAQGFLGGWPAIFYLTGLAGIVLAIFWSTLATNSPEEHKFIKADEKNYILDKTSELVLSNKEKKVIPWKKIFKSKVVICLIITSLSGNFGISLFTTCLPTYMSEVLRFNIKMNGELSSIPFLTCFLFIILSAVLSDKLIKSERYSKKNIRKFFNTLGFFIPILTLFGLMFITSSTRVIGFTLVFINITFSGLMYGAGYMVTFNDIGGVFAGIVYGVANTIGLITAVLAPFLVGIITTNRTAFEWNIVFLITALVYFIGAITFLLLAEADTQEWAKSKVIQEQVEELK